MAKNRINIAIGANLKKFSTDMQNVKREMRRTSRKMKSLGQSMTRSLTVPLGLVGVASVKLAADFEQSMAKVRAVSGATGAEFKALNDNALELGRTTRYTAAQVAELQLNLSKLGFKPKEITQSTEAILNLALASGEDLAQSATVAANTMRGFGIATEESGRVADVMAKSFSSSGLDLEKFSVSMSKIAPIAKAAGFGFEQTVSMMSALADAGVEASTIGTSLRQIFIELSTKGISFSDAMEQIRNSTNKTVTATDLFDKRAAAAAIILAENETKLSDLSTAYLNAEGSAKEMAETMDNTLQGAFLRLKSALEGAAIQIGDSLKPIIESLTSTVTKLADGFTNLSPTVQKIIIGIAGLAAVVGPLLMGISLMLPALGALKIALTGVTLSMGLWGVAIAAVVAAGVLIVRNWDKITDKFWEVYDSSKMLRVGINGVALTFKLLYEVGKLALTSLWSVVKGIGGSIADFFGGLGELIAGVFTMDIDKIKKGFSRASSSFKENMGAAFDDISKKASESFDAMKQDAKDFADAVKNEAQTLSRNPIEIKVKGVVEKTDTSLDLDDGGGSGRKSSTLVSMDAVGLSTERWASSLKKVKDGVKELKPELKNIEPLIDSVGLKAEELARKWESTMQNIGNSLQNFIVDSFAGFIDALGQEMAGSTKAIDRFGENLLGSFGQFLGEFGKMLMAFGVARLALLKSVSLGIPGAVTAIAAGAALVAIGGMIKQHMTKVGSAADGSYGGGSTFNPTSTGMGSSSTYGTSNDVLTLETVVYGRDIVLSSNRQHGTISRTRRK